MSAVVSRLRAGVAERLAVGDDQARSWLLDTYGLEPAAADQLLAHYGAARIALGLLPTQDRIVLERFFDETGDTHLVVHSTYGSRINRAFQLRAPGHRSGRYRIIPWSGKPCGIASPK